MFFFRASFNLAVCLLGYWLGRSLGGWGGGVILAYVSLCIGMFAFDYYTRGDREGLAGILGVPDRFGLVTAGFGILLVLVAAVFLWGE